MDEFYETRKRMVARLVENGYIKNPLVIRAMEKIPRHVFVPDSIRHMAYYDHPLDIGHGQTISAPHMVGIMVERLELETDYKVLEVGGGSGYHAAVVGEIVGEGGHVYSVERIDTLAKRAVENLRTTGMDKRITVVIGDGSCGLKDYAPYDRIFISCAAPSIPPPLIEQLKDNGKMLVPVGRDFQELISCEKKGEKITTKSYGGCVFVPLIGRYGFS